MRSQKGFSFIEVMIVVAIILIAATIAIPLLTKKPLNPEATVSVTCPVTDYSNGVYYFPCTNVDFGKSLGKFIQKHTELKVVTMTGDGTGSQGSDVGYFVVTEKRE